ASQEGRLLKYEWRGDFGPDYDAGDFPRSADADLLEFVEFRCVSLHPVFWVVHRYGKICLHQVCDVVCRSLWHKSRACKRNNDECDRHAERYPESAPIPMRGLQGRPGEQ